MKRKNVLEVLRPLLNSRPDRWGETFVRSGMKGSSAICLACGATDKMIMIKKHKKDCPIIAHWKAVTALRKMLGEKA